MKNSGSTFSRRLFLSGAVGAIGIPMVLPGSRATAKSDVLTITSVGGSYQDILVNCVTKPFTEETGIKVNIVPRPDLAKVRAQQVTGNIDIDVYNPIIEQASYGSKQGFWEKLDSSILNMEDTVIPPTSDIVVTDTFVAGIAWDPKKFGAGKHPTTFSEYFDLNKFPGRRAFLNRAEGTLEAALLADGVLPKNMYPLDLDRAFKALDRIKPGVAAWVTANPQTVSLLQTGEIDFSLTFSNRVKATNEPGGGTPLAFSFEQNLFGADSLTISKGTPNKENAMKYIAYYMRPEVLARISELSALVPNSKKALSMLSAETRKWMPDFSNPNNLVLSGEYWADNLETVSRRFKEWVLT
ncbi:ABC transporter substrate-binding protein [Bradyrhizobium diazoefficiens]|nr:ABC transporter substrate-binding protein [Bradyrhizobium diazoefficiens]QQO23697.1 ABC transporter substrate-binding protein [Bradyrhizobium diazoefficiens]